VADVRVRRDVLCLVQKLLWYSTKKKK
jgi:hypothetical protein